MKPGRKPKSIVSGRNLEPYVTLHLVYDDGSEDQITQWTPAQAYDHATAVLGAVEAANTDAFLIAWLVEKAGVPLEKTGSMLIDFREWRKRRLPPERPM